MLWKFRTGIIANRAALDGVPPSGGYSAEATAVFAAMPTQPDTTRKGVIDAAIVGLKADGVWSLLDMLQVYAAHTDCATGGVDWVVPSRVLTKTATPVFTVDRGYQTDGSTSYFDTGYNPSGSSNFVQDSAFWGLWTRDDIAITSGGSGWFDGTDGVVINPRTNTNVHSYRINHASSTTSGASVNSIGWHVANRSASNVTQFYKNGTQVGSAGAAVSTAVNNHTLLIGAIQAATPSQNRQFAAAAAGASLNATQHTALYNRLQTYMTAVGA